MNKFFLFRIVAPTAVSILSAALTLVFVLLIAPSVCTPDNPPDTDRSRGIDWTASVADSLPISYFVEWAETAADEYTGISFLVGERYWQEENDFVQACVWWRKAAEMGHAAAQERLGSAYLTGMGVEADPQEGFRWLLRAAEQGDVEAQCSVADCYLFGKIVEQSDAKCVYWLRKAEAQGSEWAVQRLRGLGVSY